MARGVAACFFSPPGRRWPEGSDEGATPAIDRTLAPSSRCRDLLPGGEKKRVASARSNTVERLRYVPQNVRNTLSWLIGGCM